MTSPASSTTGSASIVPRDIASDAATPDLAVSPAGHEVRQVEPGAARAAEAAVGVGAFEAPPLNERSIQSVEAPPRTSAAEAPGELLAAPLSTQPGIRRAIQLPNALGDFDLAGKAVLIATTRMLRTPEIVPLSSTSTAMNAALSPEVVKRRCGDVLDQIAKHSGPSAELERHKFFSDKEAGTLTADQWLYLGNNLQEAGRFADAEKAVRVALSLNPGNARLHLQLADVLMHQGRKDDALAAMQTALSFRIAFNELPCLRARLHLLTGELEAATDALRFSSRQGLDYWVTRAMIECSLGEGEDARTSLNTAIAQHSGDARGAALIAEAAAWMGDAALALTWFEKSAVDLTVARAVLSPFTSRLQDAGPVGAATYAALYRGTREILEQNKLPFDKLFSTDASGQV
jgi:tetratricopeptide (TPR) repeat protein